MEDSLIKTLLNVKATDHRKIQEEIKRNLESIGYEVKLEKQIWAGREGKIDVFAQKDNYTIGLEVEHSTIRKKSIEKLNALKPSLAIFLLKGKNFNREGNYLRSKLVKVNALLIHLSTKQVQKIPVIRQRYKKFERSKTSPKLKITETDLKILQSLADYRFLDTSHILALHSEIPTRTIQRRLQTLFHAGYLERPVHQFSYQKPKSYIIYTLDKKGAQLLFPDNKAKVNWAKRNKEIKSFFLWHSLMISDFRVILTLALRKEKESKLINWRERGLTDTVYLEGEKLPIAPDAFFTIEDKNDLLHFFLEADRSTMPIKRFLDKTRAYWQFWKEEGHKDRFNISVFRVLTITISEKRKENLRRLTRKSDMFLFACQKNYNIKESELILKPIWQSPKDDKKHHLLE